MPESSGNRAVEEFKNAQAALLRRYNSRAESRYINLAKPLLRTHLLESGEGEPVFLLHRSTGMAVGWVPLLSTLEERFHVIAPDHPGCGLTDKINFRGIQFREYAVHILAALFDSLGIARAALVGNSIGGYYSLAFALAHPERVSKLVLIGAPMGIYMSVPRFIRLMGTRWINGLLYSTVLSPSIESTQALFKYLLVANTLMVPRTYLYCSYISRTLPGVALSWLTTLEQIVTLRGFRNKYFIGDELEQIQQPVLFVWGEKDWFASPSIGKRACEIMPNARIEILKNTGHLPWLEEPNRTAEMVIQFLK